MRSPEAPKSKQRPGRGSELDPYKEYEDLRLLDGLDNCVVLLRKIRELGCDGGYMPLKDYEKTRRRPRLPKATVRFETEPGDLGRGLRMEIRPGRYRDGVRQW